MKIWLDLHKRDQFIWLEYGLLSLAVMAPLLLPGFILSLDLVFTPHFSWPTEASNTYIFEVLLYWLNLALPAEIIEKIILFAILLLSGVGMHRLVQAMQLGPINDYLRWGAYFAGVLYMINPFTYSRFMAGQFLVLLGYCMLPFFVRAYLRLSQKPGLRPALVTAAWAFAIVSVSIHSIGMLALVATAVLVAAFWRWRNQLRSFVRVIAWSALALAVVLLAHSFWLIPTLFGKTSLSQATAQFGATQPEAFATAEGVLGAFGNVIRLQGFWLEKQNMYVLPQEQLPLWGLVFLAIWTVVGIGVYVIWRKQKFMALATSIVLIMAILFASTPMLLQLGQNFPLLAGYREPQKFAGLIALAYAFFGAAGVAWLIGKARGLAVQSIVGVALLLLPLLSAPTMLWGFGGQLKPRQYPDDWYLINQQLKNDPNVSKVLFLPWHQYMSFDFTERITANPAAKFFDKPTLISDNPEFKDAAPTVPNQQNRHIEQEILQAGPNVNNLGQRLQALGVSHIVLAKDGDWQGYEYLNAQTDLQLVRETDNLKLYEVKGGVDG